MKSKTEKLLDELVSLHPKYIDLSLDRLKLLLQDFPSILMALEISEKN